VKTVIYYFSGTGNSLAVAKKIAAALGDTELVPIASPGDVPKEIAPEADRTGIICPVYFSGLPLMVASFAARLSLRKAGYVFAVVTYGGSGATATLRQLDGILRKHASRELEAGFSVKMPGNYILMYESPAGEKRKQILDAADAEIARIAEAVRICRIVELPNSFFGQLLHLIAYGWFASHVREKDRGFTVSASCTACGTCVAVCPAKNIRLVNNKPVWQHHCELCCSCIHTCPVKAIQAGTRTEKWGRYRNPEITVAELKTRKDDTP
jgi:ferredoxin/flavodoxin